MAIPGQVHRPTVGLFTRRDAQIFVAKLFVAFLPAAIVGLLLGDLIKANLFGSIPVAMALIVGAFVILAVERSTRAGGSRAWTT